MHPEQYGGKLKYQSSFVNRRSAGFTLTEILIAVTIIAIISVIAIPLYTQYSLRSFRTEAQADLLLCAQGMERLAAASGFSYAGQVDTDGDGTGDADNGAVSLNMCNPRSTLRYNITIQNVPADGSTFEILATPLAGSAIAGDGRLLIDSASSQFWDENNDADFNDANEDNWQED